MNRTIINLLVNRVDLALGSMALIEKQLLEIHTVLDDQVENSHHEDTRGQEENPEFDFSSIPLEVYDI